MAPRRGARTPVGPITGLRRVLVGLVLVVTLVASIPAPSRAESDMPGGAAVLDDEQAAADPEATVAGVTPTPTSTATPLPLETGTGQPDPTATPAGRDYYLTPGYGSAVQQSAEEKGRERAKACRTSNRPPTSHMLGVPGVVPGNASGNWAPLVVAVAGGAALFALTAFALRRRRREGGGEAARPGPLEGVATLVAICGGLAGLAAQFVPSASVKERPPREVKMVVRDVKPRITRREYIRKMRLGAHDLSRTDLDEVGNVVWVEIMLRGFKERRLVLEYGLYDLDAREALLPGTSKPLRLRQVEHDVQTSFVPVWVGYPRSNRFKAEFRLIDPQGVQQLAATGPMKGSPFRYACEKRQ